MSPEQVEQLYCEAMDRFPADERVMIARMTGIHAFIQPLILERLTWMCNEAVRRAGPHA